MESHDDTPRAALAAFHPCCGSSLMWWPANGRGLGLCYVRDKGTFLSVLWKAVQLG